MRASTPWLASVLLTVAASTPPPARADDLGRDRALEAALAAADSADPARGLDAPAPRSTGGLAQVLAVPGALHDYAEQGWNVARAVATGGDLLRRRQADDAAKALAEAAAEADRAAGRLRTALANGRREAVAAESVRLAMLREQAARLWQQSRALLATPPVDGVERELILVDRRGTALPPEARPNADGAVPRARPSP